MISSHLVSFVGVRESIGGGTDWRWGIISCKIWKVFTLLNFTYISTRIRLLAAVNISDADLDWQQGHIPHCQANTNSLLETHPPVHSKVLPSAKFLCTPDFAILGRR